MLGLSPSKEELDDAHSAAAAWAGMLWRFELFRFCGGGLDVSAERCRAEAE
jgi:hypothetical protein